MKCKIFSQDRPNCSHVIQREINTWLEERKLTTIKFCTQTESFASESIASDGGYSLVIIIWYEE